MSKLKLIMALFITLILFLLVLLREENKEVEQWNQETQAAKFLTLPRSTPKCEQNLSASDIEGFSSLPGHVQDFLLYGHCRHFPMLLNVPGKCGGPNKSENVFLLLVIKSHPLHYDRRVVLRKTWAKERLQNGVWIRTVFISGTAGQNFEKVRMNKVLELEHNKHQDILQWDLFDSHFNLTLKQILFLEWMEQWCPNAHFLFNGDDDIFAHTDNIVEYLQGLDSSKHWFVGNIMENNGPIRTKSSKYYIPVQIQESERYPPFCSGGGILISSFTARIIYNMSQLIPIMPLDDVYLGMCLEKAGLKPSFHSGMLVFGPKVPTPKMDPHDPCLYREVLLVHGFVTHEIYIMWNEVHRQDLRCGKMFTLI